MHISVTVTMDKQEALARVLPSAEELTVKFMDVVGGDDGDDSCHVFVNVTEEASSLPSPPEPEPVVE